MTINYGAIAAYSIGIIILFIIGRAFTFPRKLILRLVYNAIIGGVALVVINFVGNSFNFHIALNVVSALTVGTLGIPGVILLIVLKLIFNV